MSTYTVTVTREGNAWIADVDNLAGAHTYARNLIALYQNVDEVIRLVDDLDDEVQIDIEYQFEDLDAGAAAAVELAEERDELDHRRDELNAATADIIRELQAAGYSVRDIAGLLRITPGRVSQIAPRKLQNA